MGMYLVTTEDNKDGMWFEEPAGFDSEADAREWAAKQKPAPKHHSRVLYRCNEIATLAETK